MTNCQRAINIHPFPLALAKHSIYKPALRGESTTRATTVPICHQPAQRGSRDTASPGSNPKPRPWRTPGKIIEIRAAQHTPTMVWMNEGWDFLWRCEECRFVQANSWLLLILHRRNHPELYQSCRGEIFLLYQKTRQVEGHSRCFAFPTRAGEAKAVAEVYELVTDRSCESFGNFLHDHMPVLN